MSKNETSLKNKLLKEVVVLVTVDGSTVAWNVNN